jgi:hypothetical protein
LNYSISFIMNGILLFETEFHGGIEITLKNKQ